MNKLKKEYEELKKQIQGLYNKQIDLYKAMIADNELLEERKREYNELEKQKEGLYNKQIDLYKAMVAEEYTPCKHT